MKIFCCVIFLYSSIFLYAQVPYKIKFSGESDFPRRVQIGTKLLSSKPLAFSIKGGYQLPFIHWGGYKDETTNFTKQWSLTGPVANFGVEYRLSKRPHHFIAIEFEYANLKGHYESPGYLFKGGRDYWISYSKVKANSNTFLLAYYYRIHGFNNFSVFIKIGSIDRYAIENIYYSGPRNFTSTNYLKNPINKSYHEIEYTGRYGIQYCFGYDKLYNSSKEKISKLKPEYNTPQAKKYFEHTDSLTNELYINYQFSDDAIEKYKDLKHDLLRYLKRHEHSKDSISINEKINYYKNYIQKEIFLRSMKIDTYKKVVTTKNGITKVERIKRDYYIDRHSKKYKPLYEKYKLN